MMPFRLVDGAYPDGSPLEAAGHVCCHHCIHCPMSSFEDISLEGAWRCTWDRRYYDGASVYEDRCPGYVRKSCGECSRHVRCRAEWKLEHGSLRLDAPETYSWSWCTGFQWKGWSGNYDELMVGRRRMYRGRSRLTRIREASFRKEMRRRTRSLVDIEEELDGWAKDTHGGKRPHKRN